MSNGYTAASKRKVRLLSYVSAGVLASMIPVAAQAATVANPNPVNAECAANTAQFAPDNGQGINVPAGFKVSVSLPGVEYADRDCLSLGRCRVRSLRARIGARTTERMQ